MDERELLPRGVIEPPYLSEHGRPLVIAIDSRGRKVVEREVRPGEDAEAVTAVVWRMLDRLDPPPDSDG